MYSSTDTEIVILCGGLGTRLSPLIADAPKPMAKIHGLPFLDYLMKFYYNFGFKKFILCVGHKADCIISYYRESEFGKHIVFSRESTPLDTAGAVKNAEPHIGGEYFFVVNGDSFCDYNPHEFTAFHTAKTDALMSAVVVPRSRRTDAGNVEIDENTGLMVSYKEKGASSSAPYINAGIYIFNRKILEKIPAGMKVSLEQSLFPAMVNRGAYAYPIHRDVIDIGTPERYQRALSYFKAYGSH